MDLIHPGLISSYTIKSRYIFQLPSQLSFWKWICSRCLKTTMSCCSAGHITFLVRYTLNESAYPTFPKLLRGDKKKLYMHFSKYRNWNLMKMIVIFSHCCRNRVHLFALYIWLNVEPNWTLLSLLNSNTAVIFSNAEWQNIWGDLNLNS